MNNKLLVSFAVLQTNFRVFQTDFIDTLLPFISHIIIRNKNRSLYISKIKDDLYKEFGLKIPNGPIFELLHRMKKKDLITYKNGLIKPTSSLHNSINTTEECQFHNQINLLINSILQFCKDEFNCLNFTLSEIELGLLDFLYDFIDDISCFNLDSIDKIEIDNKELRFIIRLFIIKSYKNNDNHFKCIQELSYGFLINFGIVFESKNKLNNQPFRDLSVFLDTPLLFKVIGFCDEIERESILEIISRLKRYNVKLYYFKHNYKELEESLNMCRSLFCEEEIDICKVYNQTFRFCYYNGIDLTAFLTRKTEISRIFQELDIQLYNDEGIDIDDELINTLESKIEDQYSIQNSNSDNYHQINELQIRTDAESIVKISQIGKDNLCDKIDDVKILFLTTNSVIAYVAKKFFEKRIGHNNFFSPVITDNTLSTLLWLKNPEIDDKINLLKMISQSYCFLKPSIDFVDKFHKAIEILKTEGSITEEQYYLFKHETTSIQTMKEITMGDTAKLDLEHFDEGLEKIKQNIISKTKEESGRIIDDQQKQIDKYKENEVANKIKLDSKKYRIENCCISLFRCLKFIIVVFLLVATVYLNIETYEPIIKKSPWYIIFGIIIVCVALNALTIYGLWKTKKDVNFGKRLANKIFKILFIQ